MSRVPQSLSLVSLSLWTRLRTFHNSFGPLTEPTRLSLFWLFVSSTSQTWGLGSSNRTTRFYSVPRPLLDESHCKPFQWDPRPMFLHSLVLVFVLLVKTRMERSGPFFVVSGLDIGIPSRFFLLWLRPRRPLLLDLVHHCHPTILFLLSLPRWRRDPDGKWFPPLTLFHIRPRPFLPSQVVSFSSLARITKG